MSINNSAKSVTISKSSTGAMSELMHKLETVGSYRLLEPRMVFDGAAIDTATQLATEVAPTPIGPTADAAPNALPDALPDAVDVIAALASASQPLDATANALIFIDANVTNPQALAEAVSQNGRIVILDAHRSGLAQIAEIVAHEMNVTSIHIVSHGEGGTIYLGNDIITSENISSYADQLSIVGKSLTASGDILIYGCNVAAGENGASLLDRLSELTGADVAGSTDATGASELGGDWDLEAHAGDIQSVVISASAWDGILAPIALTNTTNAMTLANAIKGDGITIVSATYTGLRAIMERASASASSLR